MAGDLNIDEATRRIAEEHLVRKEAGKAAASDPLPGPLASCFPAESIRVGDFWIRPVVASDIAILKRIDSPIYKQMLLAGQPDADKVQYTEEDGWNLAFQFTRPAKEIRAMVQRGKEVFYEAAAAEIGDRVNPLVIGELVGAVGLQMRKIFDTALGYGSKPQEGEEEQPKKHGPFTDQP